MAAIVSITNDNNRLPAHLEVGVFEAGLLGDKAEQRLRRNLRLFHRVQRLQKDNNESTDFE